MEWTPLLATASLCLSREQINGQRAAEETHYVVGREVRNIIAKIGGTMPENLPREQNIKQLTSRRVNKSLLTNGAGE
jgi:DNA-damage-inducible protein D